MSSLAEAINWNSPADRPATTLALEPPPPSSSYVPASEERPGHQALTLWATFPHLFPPSCAWAVEHFGR